MWSRWLVTNLVLLIYQMTFILGTDNIQNFKINPKPCKVNRSEGTCMFVWECIKSEGQHVGMCVDSFMFGSCCSHNLTENFIPETLLFTRPTKPFISNQQNYQKPKPPNSHSKPSISGITTIERPHGAGMLVIRPYIPHKPIHQKPIISIVNTTVKTPASLPNVIIDLNEAASVAGLTWNKPFQTTQWHITTEPNFITKPKPSLEYIMTKPKPSKKKPIRTTVSPHLNVITRTSTTIRPQPTFITSYLSSTSPISSTQQTKPINSSPISLNSLTIMSEPTVSTVSQTSVSSAPVTTIATIRRTTSTVKSPSSTKIFSTTIIKTTTTSINDESNEIEVEKQKRKITTISAAKGVECGISSALNHPETRIVGGKNALFGRWPWQVSVRRTSFFGFSSTHRCGGALINENWIATAGHCVDDLLTSQIRIRVGEYDFSHIQEQLPYIERGVQKKVVHPKYNFFTYEYDLALVKLDQPLVFAPHVGPICLPATDDLLIGMNATVTGWGRLSEGGTLPSVLQEVSVPIVSNDHCKSMFLRAGRQEFIPDIFLCAGHETGGQDSCQGDSGGPLQVKGENDKYFLAGIISWGIGCAEANLPGVCTRISKFVPWMLENVT